LAVDRSNITVNGRHIPAIRRPIVSAKRPNGAAEPTATAMPRNGRELAQRLDALSSKVRRLAPPQSASPERFHEERSDIAHELQRLSEWADRQG
jgi:hypothetical protein